MDETIFFPVPTIAIGSLFFRFFIWFALWFFFWISFGFRVSQVQSVHVGRKKRENVFNRFSRKRWASCDDDTVFSFFFFRFFFRVGDDRIFFFFSFPSCMSCDLFRFSYMCIIFHPLLRGEGISDTFGFILYMCFSFYKFWNPCFAANFVCNVA